MAAALRFLHQTPEVASAVLGIFLRALRAALRDASSGAPAALRDAQLGAISFPQRFGSSLNPHDHFHVLALDGVVSGDVECGVRFHEATGLEVRDAKALARTVQFRVLRWFARRGLLDPSAAADMRTWRGTGGFSVDGSVRVASLPRGSRSQRTPQVHGGLHRTARARRFSGRHGASTVTRSCRPARGSAGALPPDRTEQRAGRRAPITTQPHPRGPASGPYLRGVSAPVPSLRRRDADHLLHHPPLHRRAHTPPSRSAASASPRLPARGPPQAELHLDQSPAFDLVAPDVIPEFKFDQSSPDDWDA